MDPQRAKLCAWAVYTDLRWGVVSNQNVLAIFGLGLIVQAQNIVTKNQPWIDVLALWGIASVIALLLYLFHFWAPGDGKLFWALCLAPPNQLARPVFITVPVQLLSWTLTLALLFTRCEQTIRWLEPWWHAARKAAPAAAADLGELLSQPATWTVHQGLATVVTPLFKLTVDSVTCADPHVVHRQPSACSESTAAGLKKGHSSQAKEVDWPCRGRPCASLMKRRSGKLRRSLASTPSIRRAS